MVKNLPAVQETCFQPGLDLGWEDPLEEGMATHSNILAWTIPWTGAPVRVHSIAFKESDMTEVSNLNNTALNISIPKERQCQRMFKLLSNGTHLSR